MASFAGYTAVRRLSRYFRPVPSIPASADHLSCLPCVFRPSFNGKRQVSTKAPSEFTGPNAYELLGVSETSSFSEIKASFRKLAKETHPDLAQTRFWLFEPRCGMHDIGGWYVETFGRDKKGRTVPSQRHWDGLDANFHFDKKLHPAMYLLALAYRTLDIEDARLRRRSIKDIVASQMLRVVRWCKTRVLRA
ncbi:hypothetical protein DM860_008436 [Cuscuta australis]|uniref:J domain-containing protein n=1 Tax=Cuscuta australis TaxID=267555 RepID=A0A328D8E1_9ASTE|nr:hypothetical protein DM860_008436 [Cuscuta australis]